MHIGKSLTALCLISCYCCTGRQNPLEHDNSFQRILLAQQYHEHLVPGIGTPDLEEPNMTLWVGLGGQGETTRQSTPKNMY